MPCFWLCLEIFVTHKDALNFAGDSDPYLDAAAVMGFGAQVIQRCRWEYAFAWVAGS